MAVWNEVSVKQLPYLRFDPEYYQPHYLNTIELLRKANAVPIYTFASVTDGIHASPEWVEDGVRYLSAKSVKDNYFVLADSGQISHEQDAANPRTRARLNDVLITTVGTIGNAAVVNEDVLPANMDRHLGIIRIHASRDDVDPYFLATFLNSRFGRAQSLRESTGNVQLNLFIDKIKQLLVPVGAISNEVALLTRQAYAKRKQSGLIYAEAERLLLHELGLDTLDLSHELTYERSFREVAQAGRYDSQYFHPRYDQITERLSAIAPTESIGQWGKILKGRSVSSYIPDGIPVIRSGDLVDLDALDGVKHASTDEDLFYLRRGDVCISSIGFGSIGKVQVFDKEDAEYATVSEVTVVRQKKVNPYYLQLFLQSEAGQKQIERRITGATGQLHLYPRDVESIIVPVLPEEKQKDFEHLIMQSRQVKYQAAQLLETAKRRVEELILAGAG